MRNKIIYPKISIIIPSYNQGPYLEQAIQSVLSQDYIHKELIVIDGGSQDESLSILNAYSSSITYWVSLPDHGQSHAINKGFEKAQGEIITYLSSDDFYLAGTFQDVADTFLKNPGSGAVVGGFCFLTEGSETPEPMIEPFLKGGSPRDLSLSPPASYRLHHVATFFDRQALEKVGFYVREDLHYVMDRDLLYRVCREFPISLSSKPYGVFRKHALSKSIADILPFAREFSNLYLMYCTGDHKFDHQREKMARYRMARGYIKYSQNTSRSDALNALLHAIAIYPKLFANWGVWVKMAQKFFPDYFN